MGQEIAMPIKEFAGLNVREPAGAIADNDLSLCTNFDLGRVGELLKRTGFEQLHGGATLGANSVKLLGHFITSTLSYLIARAGANVYYSVDGAAWTLMTATGTMDVEWGVQYADKFYMVRKTGTVLEWTGVGAPTAITGSPTGTFCTVHKERLFVLHTEATGTGANSRIWFSNPADFSTAGWPSTNTLDVKAGDGDFLTCAAITNDVLVLFKVRSSWGLYVQGASKADWVLRNLNPQIGCVSKYTPREIEDAIYFVSSRGVYKTDGASFIDISEPILPVLKNRVIGLANVNLDSAAWWDDKYIVLLQPDLGTVVYYVYHIRPEGWTSWELAGGIQPFTFMEVRTSAPARGLYSGDKLAGGKVYRHGAAIYTDNAVQYSSLLETKEYVFEMIGNYKRGKWLVLDCLGVAALVVTNYVDTVAQPAKNLNSIGTRRAIKTHGPGYFRQWRYKVVSTGDTAFTFYGAQMFMHKKKTVVEATT